MNGFKKTVLAATAALVLGFGANAQAAPSLNFENQFGVQGGTITFDGLIGSSLDGTGITFDTVNITGAPMGNGGGFVCRNGAGDCVLNFSTGAFDGIKFATAGSSFSITGEIVGISPVNTSVELVTSGVMTTILQNLSVGGNLLGFNGTDAKHSSIITHTGVPVNSFTDTATAFTIGPLVGGIASVDEADFTNHAVATVPEPGTMMLMGSGLLGLGLWRRFKK